MTRHALIATALFSTLTLATLPACVTHDYMGQHYAPTDHVEVFYAQTEVPAGYTVVGEDRAEATEYLSADAIVADIVKQAQKVGAQGVIIGNLDIVQVGENSSTSGWSKDKTEYYATTDGKLHTRHKDSGSWNSYSHSTAVRDKVITAKFLRKTGE